MPVDVRTEITIRRPRDDVANYVADPSNAPSWYQNIGSVQWKTEPPLRVGSEIAFVAQLLGRPLAYTYRVVEWVPNECLVMSTEEGPFPMETTYAWTALDAGSTLMSLRNRGEPAGFSKVAAPLVSSAIRRENRKDLARLRSILENNSSGSADR